MYSSSSHVFAQQENEAEIEANIEKKNKCKKDTECENENEINNSPDIVNNTTQQQQQQQEPQTGEEYFTRILTEKELDDLIQAVIEYTAGDYDSLEEICSSLDLNIDNAEYRATISGYLFTLASYVGISEDKINAILDCLEKIFGTEIPRPPFPVDESMRSGFSWSSTQ